MHGTIAYSAHTFNYTPRYSNRATMAIYTASLIGSRTVAMWQYARVEVRATGASDR